MEMKTKLLAFVLVVIMLLAFQIAVSADNQTIVYQFSDEPFYWEECYETDGWIPGPAAKYGENVCLEYFAMNDEVVRFKPNGDVSWTLTQHGTAYIYAQDDGELLDTGVFSVQEVARDYGGDANCVGSDGQHAWLGKCTALWSNLDFAEYHWKISGIYFFDITVRGPGEYCYGDILGTLCK